MPGDHPKCGEPFDFRRLGLRTSAMLISPWVAKGSVFQQPQKGPAPTSQFELTSLPATVEEPLPPRPAHTRASLPSHARRPQAKNLCNLASFRYTPLHAVTRRCR